MLLEGRGHQGVAFPAHRAAPGGSGVHGAHLNHAGQRAAELGIESSAHELGGLDAEEWQLHRPPTQRIVERHAAQEPLGLAGATSAHVQILTQRHHARLERDRVGEVVDRQPPQVLAGDALDALARQHVVER